MSAKLHLYRSLALAFLFAASLSVSLDGSNADHQVPAAFPGAQGGGAASIGGRGGAACEVTNLNDSGPNSARDCFTRKGPRTVVSGWPGASTCSREFASTNPF
jgi:hypothetical protein